MSGRSNTNQNNRKFDEEDGKSGIDDDHFGSIEDAASHTTAVLEKSDIDKAEKMIDQRYPLNNHGLVDVFPFLRPLVFWRKSNEKAKKSNILKKALMRDIYTGKDQTERRSGVGLLKKVKAKISEEKIKKAQELEEKKSKHNILNMLGIGIVSHYSLLEYMIFAFFVFSLLSIPIIRIYEGYDAMKGTKNEAATSTTLGNMGFVSSA